MKRVFIVLCLLVTLLLSGDKVSFSIERSDDIGILLLYNKHYGFRTISVTNYYGDSFDSGDITDKLRYGDNYLIFFIYNLPYHGFFGSKSCNNGHWRLHYYIYKNKTKVLSKDYDVSDRKNGCKNDIETLGIKKMYVYKITKKPNRKVSIREIAVSNTFFDNIFKQYKKYLKRQYILYQKTMNANYDQAIFFNRFLNSIASDLINKYDNYSPYLSKKNIKNLLRKNLFMADKNKFGYFIKQEAQRLKKLSVKFIKALKYRNMKIAKNCISAGLVKTKIYPNVNTIYNRIKKISQIENNFKVIVDINLDDNSDVIPVKKGKLTIGTITNQYNGIVAKCSYGKNVTKKGFYNSIVNLITKCKKYMLYCPSKESDKCLYVYNYKAVGYIQKIDGDSKYLWSAYTNDGVMIDEYDTKKNEFEILKKYLKIKRANRYEK